MNAPGLSNDQKVGHWIEMWKQTVEVQQHFNDIEWRIRGLALTAATFAMGAAAVAAKDGASWIAPVILAIGLLLWYAFYFVDRYWYHPLLKSAVKQGEALEDQLGVHLDGANLTKTITAGSPVRKPPVILILSLGRGRGANMHSDHKLIWFYRLGALALSAAALGLAVQAVAGGQPKSQNKPVVVNIQNLPPAPSPAAPPTPMTE